MPRVLYSVLLARNTKLNFIYMRVGYENPVCPSPKSIKLHFSGTYIATYYVWEAIKAGAGAMFTNLLLKP